MTDYTVTREEVNRRDGELRTVKTVHNNMDSGTGYVTFRITDGTATISTYSPVAIDGTPFTKIREKGSIGKQVLEGLTSERVTMTANMGHTQSLLATAAHYVEEHHDVDVKKHLCIGALERQR